MLVGSEINDQSFEIEDDINWYKTFRVLNKGHLKIDQSVIDAFNRNVPKSHNATGNSRVDKASRNLIINGGRGVFFSDLEKDSLAIEYFRAAEPKNMVILTAVKKSKAWIDRCTKEFPKHKINTDIQDPKKDQDIYVLSSASKQVVNFVSNLNPDFLVFDMKIDSVFNTNYYELYRKIYSVLVMTDNFLMHPGRNSKVNRLFPFISNFTWSREQQNKLSQYKSDLRSISFNQQEDFVFDLFQDLKSTRLSI